MVSAPCGPRRCGRWRCGQWRCSRCWCGRCRCWCGRQRRRCPAATSGLRCGLRFRHQATRGGHPFRRRARARAAAVQDWPYGAGGTAGRPGAQRCRGQAGAQADRHRPGPSAPPRTCFEARCHGSHPGPGPRRPARPLPVRRGGQLSGAGGGRRIGGSGCGRGCRRGTRRGTGAAAGQRRPRCRTQHRPAQCGYRPGGVPGQRLHARAGLDRAAGRAPGRSGRGRRGPANGGRARRA